MGFIRGGGNIIEAAEREFDAFVTIINAAVFVFFAGFEAHIEIDVGFALAVGFAAADSSIPQKLAAFGALSCFGICMVGVRRIDLGEDFVDIRIHGDDGVDCGICNREINGDIGCEAVTALRREFDTHAAGEIRIISRQRKCFCDEFDDVVKSAFAKCFRDDIINGFTIKFEIRGEGANNIIDGIQQFDEALVEFDRVIMEAADVETFDCTDIRAGCFGCIREEIRGFDDISIRNLFQIAVG